MVNIAIVDDDRNDAELIESYVRRFGEDCEKRNVKKEFHVVQYTDGVTFLNQFNCGIDVVFLDIEMPGLNGIQTARQLRETNRDVAIVFVTNMAQYAIDGYSVNAVDFILKPVTYSDFALKFKKVLRYISRTTSKKLTLRMSENECVRIDCIRIYYVEVVQHYLIFYTKDGEYRIRGTMAGIEEMLSPYAFVRCAKSFLVNLKHITAVKGNKISLSNGAELYASRTMKENFLNEFYKYLGGIT